MSLYSTFTHGKQVDIWMKCREGFDIELTSKKAGKLSNNKKRYFTSLLQVCLQQGLEVIIGYCCIHNHQQNQIFVPVKPTPSMKDFCAMKKIAMTGNVITSEAAIRYAHCTL